MPVFHRNETEKLPRLSIKMQDLNLSLYHWTPLHWDVTLKYSDIILKLAKVSFPIVKRWCYRANNMVITKDQIAVIKNDFNEKGWNDNRTWQIYPRFNFTVVTAQKMKFSIKDFFSKGDQIRRQLRIWSQLLKKFLMETSFFVQCIVHNFWKKISKTILGSVERVAFA